MCRAVGWGVGICRQSKSVLAGEVFNCTGPEHLSCTAAMCSLAHSLRWRTFLPSMSSTHTTRAGAGAGACSVAWEIRVPSSLAGGRRPQASLLLLRINTPVAACPETHTRLAPPSRPGPCLSIQIRRRVLAERARLQACLAGAPPPRPLSGGGVEAATMLQTADALGGSFRKGHALRWVGMGRSFFAKTEH